MVTAKKNGLRFSELIISFLTVTLKTMPALPSLLEEERKYSFNLVKYVYKKLILSLFDIKKLMEKSINKNN
jgi:hypothetical protein